MTIPTLRCAVLDDFQGVATSFADWSPVADRVAVTAFREHVSSEEEPAAAVDVLDIEPLAADHPMRTAPRRLATPHPGYVSPDDYRRYYGEAVEDIAAFLAGEPVRRPG